MNVMLRREEAPLARRVAVQRGCAGLMLGHDPQAPVAVYKMRDRAPLAQRLVALCDGCHAAMTALGAGLEAA